MARIEFDFIPGSIMPVVRITEDPPRREEPRDPPPECACQGRCDNCECRNSRPHPGSAR